MVSEIPATQFNAFAVERILVTNRGRKLPVRILNHTPHELIIRANQAVATVTDVSERDSIVQLGSIKDYATPDENSSLPYVANVTGNTPVTFVNREPDSRATGNRNQTRPSDRVLDEYLASNKLIFTPN